MTPILSYLLYTLIAIGVIAGFTYALSRFIHEAMHLIRDGRKLKSEKQTKAGIRYAVLAAVMVVGFSVLMTRAIVSVAALPNAQMLVADFQSSTKYAGANLAFTPSEPREGSFIATKETCMTVWFSFYQPRLESKGNAVLNGRDTDATTLPLITAIQTGLHTEFASKHPSCTK